MKSNIHIFSINTNRYEEQSIKTRAQMVGATVFIHNFSDLTYDGKYLLESGHIISLEKSCVFFRVNVENESNGFLVRDLVVYNLLPASSKLLNWKSYYSYPGLNKFNQLLILKKHGVPIPKTSFYQALDETNYPFVLKGIQGNNGTQVHLVESQSQLLAVSQKYKQGQYFIQELLPRKGDYRVVILDGKVLGMFHKKPRKGNFLTNVAQGGLMHQVQDNLKSDLESVALLATDALKCDFAGVDIMFNDKNQPCVLEVNRSPGFEGFDSFLKTKVADSLVEWGLR